MSIVKDICYIPNMHIYIPISCWCDTQLQLLWFAPWQADFKCFFCVFFFARALCKPRHSHVRNNKLAFSLLCFCVTIAMLMAFFARVRYKSATSVFQTMLRSPIIVNNCLFHLATCSTVKQKHTKKVNGKAACVRIPKAWVRAESTHTYSDLRSQCPGALINLMT